MEIVLLPLQQYAPSVFEKYTTSVAVGKKEVTLNLYDTAGKGSAVPVQPGWQGQIPCGHGTTGDTDLGPSPNPAQPFVTAGK